MAHEATLFFRQLLTKPKQVSAIAPSSRWLARAMTAGLGPHSGRVVEFGPGTGVLTRGILAAGVAARDLTLFEMSPDFAAHLHATLPDVTIHHAPAQDAPRLIEPGVSAVISGLPLLSMPVGLRMEIVQAAFDILAPDGVFVQFTYGPKPPLSPELMEHMHLRVSKGPKVWANLPPAQVYHFHRASSVAR